MVNCHLPELSDSVSIRLPRCFDLVAANVFRKECNDALRDIAVKLIELDFEEVTYVDNAALGSLLLLREQVRKSGRSIILSNCCRDVVNILEIASFQRLFNLTTLGSRCAHGQEGDASTRRKMR